MAFGPEALANEIPDLACTERVQVAGHTLTCRVERGAPVLVSFFGNLGFGEVHHTSLLKVVIYSI